MLVFLLRWGACVPITWWMNLEHGQKLTHRLAHMLKYHTLENRVLITPPITEDLTLQIQANRVLISQSKYKRRKKRFLSQLSHLGNQGFNLTFQVQSNDFNPTFQIQENMVLILPSKHRETGFQSHLPTSGFQSHFPINLPLFTTQENGVLISPPK